MTMKVSEYKKILTVEGPKPKIISNVPTPRGVYTIYGIDGKIVATFEINHKKTDRGGYSGYHNTCDL